MERGINKLPKDWKIVKVADIANLYRGINYTKDVASNAPFNGGLPILRGNNINGDLNFEDLVYVPQSLIKNEQIIKKDDIIFAMSSGSKHLVGKSAVAKNDFQGSYGAFCAMLRVNNEVNKKFVSYIFKGNAYRKLISEIAKGTNINNLKREHILDFEVLLPPIKTQQFIVSKIEELFSELDKGIENLKKAQQQLKTYRQAVLKWAFEGKLTNKNVKEGELPKGWELRELKEVCEIKRGKSKHRPRNEPFLYGGKYPFIQTGDIRSANGGYIITYSQTYSEIGLQQSKLWPKGTLCITIAANIGETAILGFDACFPDSVVGLLAKENVLVNKYTNYFFISYKQRLEELAPATAQKNINVDILEKVKIPLAPFEEQVFIIQEIENRLSVADKMEESINQSLQQAEALRQSILKRAFEGRLV
ncbi:MAG: restriction endonuclease subunit S [Bacteroidia bacterium]|nr:restriction endonuclease subunit S [Bacteroidia bacterium]